MPDASDPLTQTRSRLSRPWLTRMVLLTVGLVAFGLWGLWDATTVYPARGRDYAAFCEAEYLRVIRDRGAWHEASVEDPRGTLAALVERVGRGTSLSGVEQARRTWLEALLVPGLGIADRSRIESPRERLEALETELATKATPKPLSWYDLPSQWLITAVGLGGGLYLILFWVRVASRRYTWDPETTTLTLPSRQSIAPADLAEEADWRKWSKFIVFLKIKGEHPSLGGQTLKIDMFRYTPLEAWIMALEKAAFPDCEQPGRKAKSEEASEEPAPVGEKPADGENAA